MARLNLCERQIELGAVAHAFLDDGQHGGARQFGKQSLEPDHARGDLSRSRVLDEFSKRRGVIECKFPHCRAGYFRKMSARTLKLAQVVGQRTNVSARATFDRKASDSAVDSG